MRIAFKVYPQDSHYNATFPVARGLRALGCEVVYAGDEERRAPVEAQGFRFHAQAEDLLPKLVPGDPAPSRPRLFQAFHELLTLWSNRSHAINIPIPADGFDGLLAELKPDALLVDSPYTRFAIPLLNRPVRFGVLESMMRLDSRPGVPPPASTHVPNGTALSRLRCRALWMKYWANLQLIQLMGWHILPSRRSVRDVLDRCGIERAEIDFQRYFHLGLSCAPEFILSLQDFDFPGPLKPNQYYVGPSVDLDRVETGYDYIFHRKLEGWLKDQQAGIPLVYCSLGTASWRYPGAEDFFRRVIAASRGEKWNLVIALGTELEPRNYHPLPANVTILQRVPQIALLKHTDVAITHGGMNTISECVLLRVPMLVYPGSKELDQPGNAARVVYHSIGLKGDLQLDPATKIAADLKHILQSSEYKQRVTAMSAAALSSRAHREGARILLDALFQDAPAQ